MKQHRVVDSPYGPLTLVATGGRLSGLYMTGQRHRPPEESFGDRSQGVLGETVRQLDAYFAGELKEFDLELTLDGTPFQRGVWAQLQQIPYGETWTYGELAERLGNPAASRAVGLANGRNPVGIVVPCHRVVVPRAVSPATAAAWTASAGCWRSRRAGREPRTSCSRTRPALRPGPAPRSGRRSA